MTPDRLPFKQKPFVAEDFENFLDRVEEIEAELPKNVNCPSGHSLTLDHASLDWQAEEGVYLLGPTPVYKDLECQTTFIPSSVLRLAEDSLKASVKSPESFVFALPDGAAPLV